MKQIIAIFALLASLSAGAALADEPVDCFFEANSTHPLCKK